MGVESVWCVGSVWGVGVGSVWDVESVWGRLPKVRQGSGLPGRIN